MRGLGDDYDDSGGGDNSSGVNSGGDVPTIDIPLPTQIPYVPDTSGASVDVNQLAQENAAGAFNNLKTPQPYYGNNSDQFADPWGGPVTYATGPGGGAFTAYQPSSTVGMTEGGGGGGGVAARIGVTTTNLPVSAASSAVSSTVTSVESLFSQPVVAGSSITWGWVVLGGLALWLLMRNN